MSRRKSKLRRAWFKQRQKSPHRIDPGLMHDLYDHLSPFDHRRDLMLTRLEDETGVSPVMTDKEVETEGHSNKPRKEAMIRRRKFLDIDRMIEVDGSNIKQWFKQFIPMAVLERTAFRQVRLWAAGNTYIFSYETEYGAKLSTEYNGKEAAMHAYNNKYLKYVRFVDVVKYNVGPSSPA